MERIEGIDAFSPPDAGVVLTIGNFDGVHVGHQTLVKRARQFAQETKAAVTAVTFEPHPIVVLHPEKAPARLTTLDEKLALLERIGVEVALVLRSGPELFALQPAAFLERYVLPLRPRAVVEGPTFRFGRDRAGDADTLRDFGRRHGFAVDVLAEVRCSGAPGRPAVNSSAVRASLREGRVDLARAMLGRPHRITGVVGGGDGRGERIGFPTANLYEIPQMIPAHAVYAGVAQDEHEDFHPAAINIGPQPTFGQQPARVEAHLLDFAGDLRGRRVGLHLLARLRDQVRFETVQALSEQLARDVERVRSMRRELDQVAASDPIAL
jgi:riboflavin kinase/FMN adenylyltransferase